MMPWQSRVFKLLVLIFYAVAVIVLCLPATAASTGILAGTVTDLDGNGIPGAMVSLYKGQNLVIIPKNPQTTISDASVGPIGHYGFKDLAPGRYNIIVTRSLGAGREYRAEQQVSISAGTAIQDVVLDIPKPTTSYPQPSSNYYASMQSDGFEAVLAALALAGAVLILCHRR